MPGVPPTRRCSYVIRYAPVAYDVLDSAGASGTYLSLARARPVSRTALDNAGDQAVSRTGLRLALSFLLGICSAVGAYLAGFPRESLFNVALVFILLAWNREQTHWLYCAFPSLRISPFEPRTLSPFPLLVSSRPRRTIMTQAKGSLWIIGLCKCMHSRCTAMNPRTPRRGPRMLQEGRTSLLNLVSTTLLISDSSQSIHRKLVQILSNPSF